MKDLFVRLNPSKKQAVFFGPGTFEAKERIKALGQARWLGEEKAWQVSSLKESEEELISLFPEIADIEIEDGESAQELEREESKRSKTETRGASQNLPAGYSVAEFLTKAQSAISQAFSVSIYVYGVLGKVTESNARLFMDLVDEERRADSINCVIWHGAEELTKELRAAGFKLEPELQVMFQVSVRMDRRGRISLSVERIVAEYTIGKLAALREKTNAKLKEEGIFANNKACNLPFLPKRLGILTSSAGTVIHDFRASLDLANFGFELFWLPVSVQGSRAKSEIVAGIKKLSAMDLDALLIFRGGGAPAELAVFSEYEVAKAICFCELPVLSAIGHQEDQSSAQDVSFLAFGVPKDIGRYFADIVINYRKKLTENSKIVQTILSSLFSSYEERVSIYLKNLLSGVTQVLERKETECQAFAAQLTILKRSFIERSSERLVALTKPIYTFAEKLAQYKIQEFYFLADKIGQQLARTISDKEQTISRLNQRVEDSSPSLQLKRGFSIVRKQGSNELALRGEALKKGEDISIEFFDKQLAAKIT